MQFNCSQLSNEVMKSIFDAAFIDTELDEDGDLFVTDEMRVLVEGLPDQDCFQFTAYFRIDKKHAREKLLEACNSFNESYLGLKASIMEGNEVITFNYAVLMKGGGTIEAKKPIELFKYHRDIDNASIEDVRLVKFHKN